MAENGNSVMHGQMAQSLPMQLASTDVVVPAKKGAWLHHLMGIPTIEHARHQ